MGRVSHKASPDWGVRKHTLLRDGAKSHCKGRVKNWGHVCNLPAQMPRELLPVLLKHTSLGSLNYPRDPVPRQLQHHLVTCNFGIAKPSFPILHNAGCSLGYIYCLVKRKVPKSSLGRWACGEGCEREHLPEQTHTLWTAFLCLSGDNSSWLADLSSLGPWGLRSVNIRCF